MMVNISESEAVFILVNLSLLGPGKKIHSFGGLCQWVYIHTSCLTLKDMG